MKRRREEANESRSLKRFDKRCVKSEMDIWEEEPNVVFGRDELEHVRLVTWSLLILYWNKISESLYC